ncbi:luciferin 4-monooxygenase isoform X2 [Daktulosphaira vitifoliae]|uniref:luciferin 4-monooxygenase isoform X2 n=1 Tax=Daktulosphaira vitifoliae TaxID=58002 RepID=UPI0021A9B326|nr:luciferin 4-monooxygenase isoform X2 [Daktulosphaira vitifoliae]
MEHILHGPVIPKHILDSKTNLSQYFIRTLSEHGDKVAMVDVHDNTKITFNDILNTSLNVARWLKYECGIQKSDVVGLFIENTVWYSTLVLAVWHVGGICALYNPLYNNQELKHVLNICKPKMMICSRMGINLVQKVSKEINYLKYVCPIEIAINLKTIQEKSSFVPIEYDNNHTSIILCSSGTTGLPKGVELTHRNLYLMNNILQYLNSFIVKTDIMNGLVPMFHGYGLLVMCLSMALGSKVIVFKYFEENLFLKSIDDHKITVLFAVPPLMVYLSKTPLVNKYSLSSLRIIYSGAAPLSHEVELEVIKKIGKGKPLIVEQGYGMTELSILATCHVHTENSQHPVPPGTIGNLLLGMSAKVIDLETGKTLGAYKSGEICFKGPMVMKGYYGNPKETSNTIDEDGWLHTGDVGYYDKNLNFFIVDRIKELIKYKGYQVAPAELESLLLTHPDIEDAAVIGLPNKEAGELPMAFIVKVQGSKLKENDVINFMNIYISRVANFNSYYTRN